MKRITAIITSCFLFYSFVCVQIVEAFALPSPGSVFINKYFDDSLGKITDSFVQDSKTPQIIFIQDLHTNPSVQKNISKILESLDKQYGIDYICLEGLPKGKADTTALESLRQYNISDPLIDKNIISGVEYYFLNNNTNAKIYGIEDWNQYLSNVKKAAMILQDQDYLIQTYNDFKEDLYSNIRNAKKLEKYTQLDLTEDRMLSKINQPILKYKELHKYISLADNLNDLNIKKVKEEHNSFISDLKKDLPIAIYKEVISLSKKDDLKEYYSVLYKNLVTHEDYKEQYTNLNKFLENSLKKSQVNIVNLISQQNKYFKDYLSSLSQDKFQQELFMVKMTQIFWDFITLSISEENYNFFAENYQKYINLLPIYLSQEYNKYSDFLFSDTDIIFDYHKTNTDRNINFIKNISTYLKNKTNGNKVTVVIAGGFHSSVLEQIKQYKTNYLLVTPNVEQPYSSDFYNEMILSTISNQFETNALPQIRDLLTEPKLIPEETVSRFIGAVASALAEKGDVGIEELKNIISIAARNELVMNVPFSIDITDSRFIINIYDNRVILTYEKENGKVVWKRVYKQYGKTSDLGAKLVAKAKRKLNIFEATSLQLNPNSRYASRFFSRREGTKRNFMFTLSMILSYLRLPNDWAYDLMMGFASLNKNKTTKTTIDFDTDFGKDVKKLKAFSAFKGKKLDIIVENGLNKYLSREDIINIVAASISRLDTKPTGFRDAIFIGYLDKSTNLFEDHLNNGFIGVNAGIFQLQDEDVKKAVIQAGIIHELTHEFKGSLNSSEYDIFEERMMFCDMKFLIEFIAKIEYGQDVNFTKLLYSGEDSSQFDAIVQRITSALTAKIKEPKKGAEVPLFTERVRFIRKFQNYKYNIEDISSFIKRKNFSIRERRGQLKHIENEYLDGNSEAQEKLFSSLAVSETKEETMEEFLENHISKERINEANELIEKLIAKFRNTLYSSDLAPEVRNQKVRDFEQYIHDCLNLMYRKMPNYLFGVYYNEQGVIADHALNHSIEVLSNSIDILKTKIKEINDNKIDIQALVYAAFMHDISCSLLRLNHEQNSTTFARAILQGEMDEKEIDKICRICLGHRKVDFERKDKKIIVLESKKLTEEMRSLYEDIYNDIIESQILRDADGLSAALALDRILGVWLTNKETFLNRHISIDERIELIKANKYLMTDGGDAINDLIRQFLRRDRKYYLTRDAGDIIEKKNGSDELEKFLRDPEVRKNIKNAGISDLDIVDGIEVVKLVLEKMHPTDTEGKKVTTEKKDIKFFGLREKFNLLKQLVSFFLGKDTVFSKNIVVSDIHGGYTRFAELIVSLLAPQTDIKNKSDEEINDIIIDRLSNIGDDTMFYLLGDLLDRGDRQVETFELVKRISETGKMNYVVGNHDLYAFMNLLGLHLPFYDKYKGIPDNYIDFRGRSINALLKKLQSKDKDFLKPYNIGKEEPLTKVFWAEKLEYYMQFAEEQQEQWSNMEQMLQDSFAAAFGPEECTLNPKGKDVLNDQSKILSSPEVPQEIKALFADPDFIDFHKKFFGRNVGIAVYTGIRAANKMSINWWLDRKAQLNKLKDKYSKEEYAELVKYWQQIESVIDEIIKQQEDKYDLEINEKHNIAWAVIDAIMYRNYESTEWNALDWAYHKNWGGGDNGFIAQRNKKLEAREEHKINRVSYFEDSLIQDMLKFYHDNFYLYRFDEYGICYMHSMLPVDDEGDVSLGFVDKNGTFHDVDKNGKRIKGFIYKGVHYKGKNIFEGLNKIAEDIRNYKLESNDLSEIMEALTLLTAIYADNTTRIKPANLKEMKEKFGFNKILRRKGITTIVVGHNPIDKLDKQFEYVTLRFFNKEFRIINVIQVDGNMSPGYKPPKGAGLVRFIGGERREITTRGFLKGDSTEITSSVNPDVTPEEFTISIILNIFPMLKNILVLTGKIYNGFVFVRQKLSFGNIKINKRNTTIIDLITDSNDIQSIAEREHINGIKNIVVAPIEALGDITLIDDAQQTLTENLDINGTVVNVEIKTHKIKVAKGYIPVISYSYTYDKENATTDEQTIKNKIREYIIDQINNKLFDIKTTKNMFVNDSLKDTFELVSMPTAVKNIFGPILYDTRAKRGFSVLANMSENINIDKIKDILSAA